MLPAQLLALAAMLQLGLACPAPCSCKWRQGKRAVSCVGAGLSDVPDNLDASTQVLNLSGNNFHELGRQLFLWRGLVNLQRVFLSNCAIASIADDAFSRLSIMVELDLSRNQLQTVPTTALRECPGLRQLQLSHNPITAVEEGAFSSLGRLNALGLGNCRIQQLAQGSFEGLGRLEFLDLQGNQLTTLPPGAFLPLGDLSEVLLHDNPWNCDCGIREARRWLTENFVLLSTSPVCQSPPPLRNVSWAGLALDDFACVPQMIPAETEYSVIEDHDASLVCRVHAVPRASVHWEDGDGLRLPTDEHHAFDDEASSRQTSILTVRDVRRDGSNVFCCVAENKAGTSRMNFSLTVLKPDNPQCVCQCR